MPRFALIALCVVLALGGGIQAVPYGRRHENPPVLAEPSWDTSQTQVLAARACFDCHSNKTIWPWYSNIAPISWLVQRDVDQGRRAVNFSEWNRPQKEAREAAKTVREGGMPPWIYTIRSASARLSVTDKEALARGLAVTLATGRGAIGTRESNDER